MRKPCSAYSALMDSSTKRKLCMSFRGHAQVPAIGWFQYTIFCGICDLWLLHQVPTNPAGKLCTRLFGEGATNYERTGGIMISVILMMIIIIIRCCWNIIHIHAF